MMAAIQGWWQALSIRERWLVAVAGGLALLLLGWFLILRPLQSGLIDARAAHGAALDRHAAITARVAMLRAADRTPRVSNPAAVSLIATQFAAEADLPLSRNDAVGDTGASIAIAAARAPAALALIATLEDAGVIATDVSLRRNGDGTVALTTTLERAR